jgi:methylmalonyl-CoA mutase N-terminal domain/subunit
MYKAVESGLVQRMIGASALRFQHKVDRGEQTIVGVNAYRSDDRDDASTRPAVERPDPAKMRAHLDAFAAWKASRSPAAVGAALDDLSRAAEDPKANVFAAVVDGARAGLSNEEICARLRRDLGFGQPLAFV